MADIILTRDPGETKREVAVAVVQQRLKERGYSIDVDGIFGSQTEAVVKSFQLATGLSDTGVVDPGTLTKLGIDQRLLQTALEAWPRLTSFRPPKELQHKVVDRGLGWHFHRIETARYDLNIDFYPVRVSKLPTINGTQATATELLKLFRIGFNDFLDHSVTTFEPYDPAIDKPLMEGADPRAAIGKFRINYPTPFNITDGSVALTEYTSKSWIFSTIWTLDDQDHPVSGNREFGYLEIDGEIIFYVRAADRITEFEDVPFEIFFGIVFGGADKLWISFQQKFSAFVNEHEGQAEVRIDDRISQRIDWDDFKPILFQPTSDWHTSPFTGILDWIFQKIAPQVGASNQLKLDEGILGDAETSGMLAKALGTTALTLQNATVVTEPDRITVRGLAPMLTDTAIPTEVTFVDDDGLVVNVAGRVPAQTPLASDIVQRFVGGKVSIPEALADLRIKTVTTSVFTAKKKAVLEIADTGDTKLAGVLKLRQPKLTIDVTKLADATPDLSTHFSGLLVVSNVPFRVDAKVGKDSAFSIVPTTEALLSSEQLILDLIGGVVSNLPDLPITDLNLLADFDSSDFTLSAAAAGTFSIPLGIDGPELSNIFFAIEKSGGNVSGRIAARMKLGGQTVDVQGAIPGKFTIGGTLSPFDLLDFAGDIVGPVLSIPSGIPNLRFNTSQFLLVFGGDTPKFMVETTIDRFGELAMVVAEIQGKWEVLVAAIPPTDWKFSDLSPIFSPLNVFKVKSPRVIIASFSEPEFEMPAIGGIHLAGRVREGVALEATLILEGGGLGFVADLVGLKELPLSLAALNDLTSAEISASLQGQKVLVPSVLTLENVEVALTPRPLSAFLRCEAIVVIGGTELPRFRVAVGISDATQKFSLHTAEAWVDPLGISGLTIRQLILDVQTAPDPAYGILGEVEVAGRIILVAAQFVGNAPSAIVGELQGKLALSEVVKDLVGLTLPAVLDLSIEDFSLQIVSNPLGVMIGNIFFEAGLSIRGTLGILGMELLVNVRIRPNNGVFASGALKEKVEFGRVLCISNATGDGPPSMLLDTTGSPMLQLSGKLLFLGLSETIEAAVDRSGFQLRLERNMGVGRYALDVKFESVTKFQANGSFEFGLSASINTDLGKIVLDTGFSGALAVQMRNGVFELNATGSFVFVGNVLKIPRLRITTEFDSLEEIPPKIRQLVIDRAKDVFQSVLEDPAKWVQAIADKGIREVEDVAKQLKERFDKDAEFIGRQLKTVLLKSSVEVGQALKGIGEAPERIATILRDLNDPAANVREALERIGIPAAEVGRIMRDVFPSIPHLDETIHTDTHADSPVIPPIRQHTDTPLVPHIDQHTDMRVIPHVDQHTDTRAIPPVRQHTDTPLIPGVRVHTDGRGPGLSNHVDTRFVKSHQDVPGPHLDAHTDTPRVGHGDVHTDTRGQGHLDAHNDQAHRGHIDAHNDEARRGHLDAHNDEPGRGHLDAHGDASTHVDTP
jgi:hypothetical protein